MLTDVFMPLDVFQHGPLLVIPVISSLSVGLKLLDSGGGGSAWADPVHRGRDSLAEPGLDGPYLPEDLEKYRLHALVYATLRRNDAVRTRCLYLCARLGGAAVSHWATADGSRETRGEQPVSWQVGAAAGALQTGLYQRHIKNYQDVSTTACKQSSDTRNLVKTKHTAIPGHIRQLYANGGCQNKFILVSWKKVS